MFHMWQTKKNRAKEVEQLKKIAAGQDAMRSAISSTTSAAEGLVEWLKHGLGASQPGQAVLLCEQDGSITGCNGEAQSLFRADATHHSIREFLYPDGDPLDKVWASIFAGPQGAKTYMIGLRKGGESFPVEVSVNRIEPAGETPRLMVTIRSLDAGALVDFPRNDADPAQVFRTVADSVHEAMTAIRRHSN